MRIPAFFIVIFILTANCGGSTDSTHSKKSTDGSSDAKADQGKPKLVFVNPSQNLETDQDLKIEVKLSGNTKNLTWNLYSRSLDEEDQPEEAIAKDRPARDQEVLWNTATVKPGTYALFATFSSPMGKGRAQAKAQVTIKEGNRPKVVINSPGEEKVLLTTAPLAIAFKGDDPDGTALTFTIEYSPDDGKTWTKITEGLTTPSYAWNVKKLEQGARYKLRVTAVNSRGLSGSATMVKPFGLAAAAVTYATSLGTLLNDKCAACHGVGTVNAPQFRSDSYDLATTGVSAKADSIKKRTQDDTMPPKSPLTSAEKDIITLWSWGGGQ